MAFSNINGSHSPQLKRSTLKDCLKEPLSDQVFFVEAQRNTDNTANMSPELQPNERLFDVVVLNDPRNLMSHNVECRHHNRGLPDLVEQRKSYSVLTVTLHA